MMGRLRRVALLVCATLVFAGCGLLDEGDASTVQAPPDATTVRVGALHTIGVDDKLWLGQAQGHFAAHGVNLQVTEFDTGIAASQALTSGSIDVAIMGGVTSNFPARGQGKIFLLNSVETDTAQLWVSAESGINDVSDLRGRTVVTTEGTTADIYLLRALTAAGLDRSQVNVVNAAMPNAVQAFASGSVDAIALWVPFDLRVQSADPDAVLADSAGRYPDAKVVDGWIANNDWYANNRETMKNIIRGWLDANAAFRADPAGSLKIVQETAYAQDATLPELEHQIQFQTDYTNEEWLTHYRSGDVLTWVGDAERAFVELGGVPEFVEPENFFDTSLFVETAEEWLQR